MSQNRWFSETLENLPTRLADHEIVAPIARGSYGTVWLAKNSLTGIYRALKIVPTVSNGRASRRELDAIKAFEPVSRSNAGFVQVLHVGELPDAFFYIMELADDVEREQSIDPLSYRPKTLHDARLSLPECLTTGIALAEALSALHARGLIHRDIKPSNIIFVRGQPKLADIGLVADVGSAHSFVGTEGFIPPEGPTSFQADIYAIGKVLYEIATGKDRLDFPSLPDEKDEDHALLLELNEIILRACAEDRKIRYATAGDLASDLHLLKSGKSIQRMRHLEKALRRWRKAGTVAGIAVIVGFGVFALHAQHKAIAREQRERELGALIARGTERMKRGEYLSALVDFEELLRLDPERQRDHRLRIAAVRARSVSQVASWNANAQEGDLSGNGKIVGALTGSGIVLYDTLTGLKLRNFNGLSGTELVLDQEGEKIALWRDNSLVLLENAHQSSCLVSNKIVHAAFGNDGTVAITCPNLVELRGPLDTVLDQYPIPGQAYRSFFSPTGRYLATATFEGLLFLWDRHSAQSEPLVLEHASIIYHATFSPDEQRIITSSFDRSAVVWRVRDGDALSPPLEHDDGVSSSAFMLEAGLIVTAGLDRRIKLWSASNYKPLRENHLIEVQPRLVDVEALSSNLFVTRSDGGVYTTWKVNPESPVPVKSAHVAEWSKTVVRERGVDLRVVDRCTVVGQVGDQQVNLDSEGPVECIAVNESRTALAIATRDDGFKPHAATIYFPGTKRAPVRLPHDDGVTFVTFSHDGARLVTCSEDFSACLWDLSGKALSRPMRQRHQVRWATFSKDDRWVATASWDGTVVIWDARNGDPLTPALTVGAKLEHVEFNEDETEIIASNEKFRFRLALPGMAGF